LIRIFNEVVFNSFSHIPSIFPRNHTSFIFAVYKVQNNTNRRQDYRQRPALGRNLQLSNTACSYCGFHHEGRGCPALLYALSTLQNNHLHHCNHIDQNIL
jgi:hypothetical protein